MASRLTRTGQRTGVAAVSTVAVVAAALAASGLATAGLAGAATAHSATTPATTAWAATGTKALTLNKATLLGKASASQPLRITVGLTPRNRAGLDALIKAQNTPGNSEYEHFLTPAEFTADYAATTSTAGVVRNYLLAQGLTNVTLSSNRLQLTANATVAQAQKAFHTSISSYRQAGKTVLANTLPAQVPTSMAGMVSAVLGLSTLGFSAAPSVTVPKLTGYYPKEFTTVYNAAGTTAGTNSSLAVIAEGDLTQTVKDLRTAESKQKLPQVPVSLVYAGPKSTDTAGADEWDLDSQTSTGVAPNAKKLYFYVATSLTDGDLANAINKFVSQDVAQSGSASLGECDLLPYLDGSMLVDDMALAEASAQGQTFFASTGDTGSSCAVVGTNGVPGSGLPDTEYPSSSPYTVGVGGTTLDTTDADAYTTEVAWNSGGGGASPVENGGYWQTGVVPTAAANVRGVPDIALDADPDTGAQIYVDGVAEQIGGTSLSSPLAMGLWTRVQSSHANKLGFAAPKLYALYTKAKGTSELPPTAVPGFHDVIAGVNGAYSATPGWDYTTGLGSFNVSALSKALK